MVFKKLKDMLWILGDKWQSKNEISTGDLEVKCKSRYQLQGFHFKVQVEELCPG